MLQVDIWLKKSNQDYTEAIVDDVINSCEDATLPETDTSQSPNNVTQPSSDTDVTHSTDENQSPDDVSKSVVRSQSSNDVTPPVDVKQCPDDVIIEPTVVTFDRLSNLQPVLFDIFADNTVFPAVVDYVSMVSIISPINDLRHSLHCSFTN